MKFFWIFESIDLEKKKRKKIIDSNVKKIKKNLKKKKTNCLYRVWFIEVLKKMEEWRETFCGYAWT